MPHRAAEKRLPQSSNGLRRPTALTRRNTMGKRILLPLPQLSDAGTRGHAMREQILLQPERYIGSLEKRKRKLWVGDGFYMKERVVTYVPGLLQIFDEILVYAADNKQRDPTMDTLRVDVDVVECRISVFNSGKGIPIELHRQEGVYVPEVIFGHLSNCDHNVEDVEERNSYGVKLANIFSTEFVVETADGPGQKKYKQVFSENMGKKSEPEITGYNKGVNWSWTMVTFKPDLAKFNLTYLGEDDLDLMMKRVLDMAVILGFTVQVVFNGGKMRLPVPNGFPHYVYLHIDPHFKNSTTMCLSLHEKVNDQWEVGVTVTRGRFKQVSLVNKVATISGGTHVDYVSNLIVAGVVSLMKDSFGLPYIGEHDVKRHLMVFVKVLMKNPTFSSMTKEKLTTPPEYFGSELKFSDEFIWHVTKLLFLKIKKVI